MSFLDHLFTVSTTPNMFRIVKAIFRQIEGKIGQFKVFFVNFTENSVESEIVSRFFAHFK